MKNRTLKVLLIGDHEDDIIIMRDLLDDIEDRDFRLEWISDYSAALEKVQHNEYDVCLTEYRLGERDGLELFLAAQDGGCRTPFILFTGQVNKEVDVEAMQAGVADFLVKGEITGPLLDRSIRYAIERKRVKEKLADAAERLTQLAQYDDLTGLPNRSLFRERLDRALARSRRNNTMIALMFLDLDRFKAVNDTLGHDVGDNLLNAVGKRLRRCLREVDTVARWGGDEFTVILEDVAQIKGVSVVAQRLIDALTPSFELGEHELFATTSIGIAVYPSCGKDAETLTKNADTAMYRAKAQGRNNYQFYIDEMNARANERLHMENKLRRALEREEFLLHYQPIIELGSDRVIGAEALLRWQNAGELISPADFIPLLEETGLIVPVGEWVLHAACTQNQAWRKCGLPSLRMSVNLSARQFQGHNLARMVEHTLEETGLDPRMLVLEITEGIVMEDSQYSSDALAEAGAMGIGIAMDDFGTGYSSLSYLKRFPIDVLKIDRSFIRDITDDPDDAAIVEAIIAMAQRLRLRVVAEGVETQSQLDFLASHGCHAVQGFLLGRPMPAETFAAWFEERLASPAKGAA